MVRTVLFISLFIAALAACLMSGCARAPHPLLRALAPSNILTTIKDSTTITGHASAVAKAPLLPAWVASADVQADRVIIRLQPGVDPIITGPLLKRLFPRKIVIVDPNEPKPLDRDTGGKG